jgi:hypothetical protein
VKRALLAAVVLLPAAFAGAVSVRHIGEQMAVLSACEAADAGDWDAALAGTAGRVGPDETGRAAAECRCRALLARGGADTCAALLEEVLSRPEADGWTPSPDLAAHLINTRREQGRALEAAELARRAARRYPADPDLFYLEILTRSALEDEGELLRELAARVPPRGPAAARMRTSLANRHLLRGDPAAALTALGETPPPEAGSALPRWFELRGMAQASSGDLAGLRRTYAAWRAAGADPRELRARLALTLSIAGVALPDRTPIERLQEALADPPGDPALEEALTIRLVLTLVTAGRVAEALEVYDRSRERFALAGLSRDEIERAAANRSLADRPDRRRGGRLRFRVADAPPGARLALSPPPDLPVDSPYAKLDLPASGRLTLERELDVAPVRWLLLDARERVLASGTASPERDPVVEIRPGAPHSPEVRELVRPPGDGRRRVALVLLDCADWRIVQYLRARGELPVLSALLARGHRAVLESEPPLTAAALESLVWPDRRGPPSTVGLLHRFGVELAGLESVGANPFGLLRWLLPEGRDLFSVIGSGPHAAANLLFAHGGIRSGRHAIVTGPDGRQRSLSLRTSARDLDAAERARFPALAAVRRERDAIHLRTIAAELDGAVEILRAGEVDLLALRVEPLDILTHAHFAEAVRDGQDDGAGLLFSVYRYLDARLADVHGALDADDVFIVMSDHGIRTAMEHSPLAFFVAAGDGIEPGRSPGRPALAGVSRLLAELLAVDTTWSDTGLASLAR